MYGYIKSQLQDTDKYYIPGEVVSNVQSIDSYCRNHSRTYDQGDQPFCVPYSVQASLDISLDNIGKSKNLVNYIWSNRTSRDPNGMTIPDALSFLESSGYVSSFYRLASLDSIKCAIVALTPPIIALQVNDPKSEQFWKGSYFTGGHAVAVIGWNEKGFLIKNSWGVSYGANGVTTLPYEDVSFMYEAWSFKINYNIFI